MFHLFHSYSSRWFDKRDVSLKKVKKDACIRPIIGSAKKSRPLLTFWPPHFSTCHFYNNCPLINTRAKFHNILPTFTHHFQLIYLLQLLHSWRHTPTHTRITFINITHIHQHPLSPNYYSHYLQTSTFTHSSWSWHWILYFYFIID